MLSLGNSPALEGFEDDDENVDLYDNDLYINATAEPRHSSTEDEKEKWKSQRFSSKFTDVMGALKGEPTMGRRPVVMPACQSWKTTRKEAVLTESERGDNKPNFLPVVGQIHGAVQGAFPGYENSRH